MGVWKEVLCVLWMVLFCWGGLEARQLRVEVSAQSAVLMNAKTGAVLFEKKAHEPAYPASITKIATALYALERKGHALEEEVVATVDAVATVSTAERRYGGKHPPYRLEFGGTHIGIRAGEVLPLKTLFYGLMLPSGNDAANVIAEHVSGSVPAFMQELNRYLLQKGCMNTVFHTPHGMPHEEHKTTAYDMALIAREALKHPFFCQLVKTVRYPRPETNKQSESLFLQNNALLKPGPFYYPKAIGIKTGYSLSSGCTLVAAAEDQGRTLIAVLLGCEKNEQRYRDAIALFEAAFAEVRVARTLFAKGFEDFSLEIRGAKTPLRARLDEDVTLEYYPSEEPQFRTQLRWEVPSLPIAQGICVGKMHVLSVEGRLLKTVTLSAKSPVEPTLRYQCGQWGKKGQAFLASKASFLLAALGVLMILCCFYRTGRLKGR